MNTKIMFQITFELLYKTQHFQDTKRSHSQNSIFHKNMSAWITGLYTRNQLNNSSLYMKNVYNIPVPPPEYYTIFHSRLKLSVINRSYHLETHNVL